MQKKVYFRYKLIYGLILLSFLSFTGGSCGQQLKSITIIPGNSTISTPGVATAIRPGAVNVTATLGTLSGSTTLTVSSAALQSIMITPANPVLPNSLTQQFTATGIYSDGSRYDVTSMVIWSSTSTTVATINAIGLATAAAVGSGPTTITAALGSVSGSTTLTVNGAIILSSITVATATTLPVGLSQQFAATGNYTDGSSHDVTSLVTWVSSSTSFATISTTGGLATARNAGNPTITAALGSISGSVPLIVSSAPLQSISVTTPSSPTVPTGRSVQFAATGTYSDSTTHDLTSQVTWSAATPTAAFVNNFGLATAIGPASSTSAIVATLGPISGSATLTVNAAGLQSLTLTPGNLITPTGVTQTGVTIPTGASQKFTATANYSDGSNYDVTSLVGWSAGFATNPVATMFTGLIQQFRAFGTYNGGTTDISSLAAWSSGNPAVATIVAPGYALAFGSGTASITASLDGISISATLTVSPAVAMKSITITPANLTLATGSSQQFTATGNYYDGSVNNVTPYVAWNSDNSNVALVNVNGVVTGLAPGKSNLSATLGSFTGVTTLTVQ